MNRLLRFFFLASLLAPVGTAASTGTGRSTPSSLARVLPEVWARLAVQDDVEVMVWLRRPEGVHPWQRPAWQEGIRRVQDDVMACAGVRPGTVGHRYHALPALHLTATRATIDRLAHCSGVQVVGENRVNFPLLSESVPLIHASDVVETTGYDGSGTTVAILDTGVDYTNSELGDCWGEPDCRVAVGYDFADNDDNPMACDPHGTNVAAIAAGTRGVAPGARIAALKVFPTSDCTGAWDDDVNAALDWVVDNGDTYHIVAVNLSLGLGRYSDVCDAQDTAGYSGAVNILTEMGILVVAAAGNDGLPDAVSYPACLENAMAVANSYDSDMQGVLLWAPSSPLGSPCSDRTPMADQLVCNSNGGDLIDLAAPGALIDAGGVEEGGTSQAAPHVTGAAAILAEAAPGLSLEDLRIALTTSNYEVVDDRSGVTRVYPRLDVLSAIAMLPDTDGDGFRPTVDCDEGDPDVNPAGRETCNRRDDNCNGLVDEGFDEDGDGVAWCGDDCDDSDPDTYPGAPELDDGIDNDCNGLVDDNVVHSLDTQGAQSCGCTSVPVPPSAGAWLVALWTIIAIQYQRRRRPRLTACEALPRGEGGSRIEPENQGEEP